MYSGSDNWKLDGLALYFASIVLGSMLLTYIVIYAGHPWLVGGAAAVSMLMTVAGTLLTWGEREWIRQLLVGILAVPLVVYISKLFFGFP